QALAVGRGATGTLLRGILRVDPFDIVRPASNRDRHVAAGRQVPQVFLTFIAQAKTAVTVHWLHSIEWYDLKEIPNFFDDVVPALVLFGKIHRTAKTGR